jgi:hypothetical protein
MPPACLLLIIQHYDPKRHIYVCMERAREERKREERERRNRWRERDHI